MFNAYSINASPLNTATVLGAAERMAVNALSGAVATAKLAVQRFLSVQASATAAGTVLSTFFKQKNLAAAATAGVFYVTTDMNLFKGSLGYTIKYLSAAPYATAKATPATPLSLLNNMVVNAGAGARATAAIAVQRYLSAQGKATALGYETGFFSNAYMSANVVVAPNVSGPRVTGPTKQAFVQLTNIRGLSGLSGITGLATAAGSAKLANVRAAAASANATATGSAALTRARGLGVAANATALAAAGVSKAKNFIVNANATATATVTMAFNIYARAPSQRIVYAASQPRIVMAPPAPRAPIEDIH